MHPQLISLYVVTVWAFAGQQPQMAQAVGFWNGQFSTSEFALFQYKDLLTVTIFQHLTKNNSFYITPLVLLDHKSGLLRYNSLTEFHELRFKVIMWDAELHDSIVTYLTTVRGITKPEVKMVPIERIRFQWTSSSRPLKKGIIMETEFISTHHLPRYLTLTFACKDRRDCGELYQQVQARPEVIDRLEMQCFITAQKAATKTVKVRVKSVTKTNAFAKLTVLPPDGNYWYMRGKDFNNLTQETFSNVLAETMLSGEYVDGYEELNMEQIIKDSLKQDEISSNNLIATQWDSVFWDPVFARPDRVARVAASVFRKNASTDRLEVNKGYIASSSTAQKLFTGEGNSFGFDFGLSGSSSQSGATGIDFSVGISSEDSSSRDRDNFDAATRKESFTANELNDRLSNSSLNIQWDGEKFVVKPMRLVRLNNRVFKSDRELVSNNMQLTLYQQLTSLKVIVNSRHNQSWLLTDASESTAANFPTEFNYCLLSNGGLCPPGFQRSSGHMKAIRLDTSRTGYIRNARLGDSAIKCHSPGDTDNCGFKGWEPYKGELHLHACCR